MAHADAELILAVNSGSSSLKLGWFVRAGDDESPLLTAQAENIGRPDARIELRGGDGNSLEGDALTAGAPEDALRLLCDRAQSRLRKIPVTVGHRIVHGGPSLTTHCVLTPSVISTLEESQHFAPLHVPVSLALVRRAESLFPQARQIACFDTAFHQTMPAITKRLPIPEEMDQAGIRRYGFHGLSYESVVHRLGNKLREKTVIAHLGSGASLCALHWGRSVDTTMSFTPTGGIPMATRTGDLDPGVLLFLLRNRRMSVDDLEDLMTRKSGLKALHPDAQDMQLLLERAADEDPVARFCIDYFVHAIRKAVGAYAATLHGLDLLVFTGGIGEHSQEIRRRVCCGLEFLGLTDAPDCPKVLVLQTEEERQIARICRSLDQATQSDGHKTA